MMSRSNEFKLTDELSLHDEIVWSAHHGGSLPLGRPVLRSVREITLRSEVVRTTYDGSTLALRWSAVFTSVCNRHRKHLLKEVLYLHGLGSPSYMCDWVVLIQAWYLATYDILKQSPKISFIYKIRSKLNGIWWLDIQLLLSRLHMHCSQRVYTLAEQL